VDLIASLYHNYHTSEKMFERNDGQVSQGNRRRFQYESTSASEFKTENFDKIDTCMELFLTFFLRDPFTDADVHIYECTLTTEQKPMQGKGAKANARQGRQMGKPQSKAPSPSFRAASRLCRRPSAAIP
jgi:hypothetical protein